MECFEQWLFLVILYLWMSFLCNPVVASDKKTIPNWIPLLPLELQNPQPDTWNSNFWLVQPTCFAYPEAKPYVSYPEVVSGIAWEEQHIKFSWLLSQQEFFFLEKKKWSWDCQRVSSTFSIAPRNSLSSLWFYWSHSHSPNISVMVCFSFRKGEPGIGLWDWLLNTYFDLDQPVVTGYLLALKIPSCAKILVL